MNSSGVCWIGADPGGRDNFGVAIVESDGTATTWCVSFADEAVDVVAEHLSSEIGGAGVDAPLWWSSGQSGGRRADQWLRDTHGLSGGQVQSTNSLRGAALVQGVMFVQRLRERCGTVNVTEAHPKAVMRALGHTWFEFRRRFAIATNVDDARTHERDAIIAAVSAREGFEGRWTRDLSIERTKGEQDPKGFWLAPIHYFWPS